MTMHLVPSTEAKAQLAELLRAVERGESFCITRHGKPIAHLLPAASGDRDARRDAIDRFRAQQKTWEPASMSAQDIQDARHEGHRA